MSNVFICGVGATSPAGWGVPLLLRAVTQGQSPKLQTFRNPNGSRKYTARTVPALSPTPAWIAHSRLRRASALTHFALSATLEALERSGRKQPLGRLGIVTATHAACLRYSARFYDEVLKDPRMASPLLFPETVINAPASHVATFLGGVKLAHSLIGDQTVFVQALLMATRWLLDNWIDTCIVVSAEEAVWPLLEAMRLFAKGIIASEGAGALVLTLNGDIGPGLLLERITNAHIYAAQQNKHRAVSAMRAEFPPRAEKEILIDSHCGVARLDAAERLAWQDWSGPRLSPRIILGEALSAATAWQCIAACDAVARGTADAANVSAVGGNQQAIGVRFQKS